MPPLQPPSPRTVARAVDRYSDGEQQRIAVARVLAADPAVILADEPTAALDRANADALDADLVALAARSGRTLNPVTHDASLAARMGGRITLADGRIVEDSDG
jgi:putative ABC transport system ATP-binding protein